jgi:arylsulfatase A-like enzyme
MKSFSVLLSLVGFSAFAAAAERPNILLIMADDLGIEGLSCYGSESYETPNLDRLAAEGIRFTHAYSQPLCTPTRVQLMTGKYNHRNWLYFGILDPAERTFGHLMQDAGYETAIAGKWQLQSYDPPDYPNAERRRGTGMKVADAGFDDWSLYHAWNTEDKGSRYGNPSFERNGELVGPLDGEYGPDTSVDFLLDFMTREREKPFFAYFAMALPHWPVNPTPDSEEWADPSKRLEESDHYFPDMVHYMDKVVGQLADGLAEAGLREKTLILFYSDNGTDTKVTSQFRGEAIQGGKASPLQTGIRVPLIARWSGKIEPRRICDDLIDASDFLPTMAELAGIEIPGDWPIDGVSFVPSFFRENAKAREASFFWYDPRPGWDKEKFSRHIFALDHHYKLFSDGRLFDISGDGFKEILIQGELSPEALAAKSRLQALIDENLSGPMSANAKIEVDAFGDPVP